MRRSPRAAMTTNVMYVIPTSAAACMFSISASRPRRIPAFAARRRSSVTKSSASTFASRIPVAGGEVAPSARSDAWLAAFSSRRACGRSSSKRARAASRSVLFVNLHLRSVGKEQKGATPLQFVPVCVGAFDDEGGNKAVGVERMYGLRPIAGVGHQCPQLLDRSPVVFRRPERDASMIGKRNPPKHRPRLVTIELPHCIHYGLQDVCVGGRFAGEVSGIELGDGGIEIVELEQDDRRDADCRS